MSSINILKLKLQIKFPSALPTKINRGHIMFCLNVFSWQSMNPILLFLLHALHLGLRTDTSI